MFTKEAYQIIDMWGYNRQMCRPEYAGSTARSPLARSAPARPRVRLILLLLHSTKDWQMSTADEPANTPTDEQVEIEIAQEADQIIQQSRHSAAALATPPDLSTRP